MKTTVKRFNKSEIPANVRSSILKAMREKYYEPKDENIIFGLFDGYYYSEIEKLAENNANLKFAIDKIKQIL